MEKNGALDRPDSVPFMAARKDNMRHKRRKRHAIARRTSGEITDRVARRAINGPAGTYKGYKLLESEYPRDPMDRLKWGGAA